MAELLELNTCRAPPKVWDLSISMSLNGLFHAWESFPLCPNLHLGRLQLMNMRGTAVRAVLGSVSADFSVAQGAPAAVPH